MQSKGVGKFCYKQFGCNCKKVTGFINCGCIKWILLYNLCNFKEKTCFKKPIKYTFTRFEKSVEIQQVKFYSFLKKFTRFENPIKYNK